MMIDWKVFVVMLLFFTGAAAFLAGVGASALTDNPLWMLLWAWPTISVPLAIAMLDDEGCDK